MSITGLNTERPLRVAVVGVGRMGRHHATAIRRLDGTATLAGVVDGAEAARTAAARDLGVSAFPDLQALLAATDVDVVHVCTAPDTHVEVATQVLEAGRHVYVEKPIAPTVADMRRLTGLALGGGLSICAGHQLLFEPPMVRLREYLPALGRPVHVESWFSFRTVRRAAHGGAPLRADLQLLDILPHPVYLLLEVLRLAQQDARTELRALEVGERGTVHALVARGDTTAVLAVTLEGRPVESYLRVVGSNGSAHADFVRGTMQRLIGPGHSGIDKALNPYRIAKQLVTGTTAALTRRMVRRQRTYPGLAELFEAFYGSIARGEPSPTPPDSLEEGVAIWEEVAGVLAGNARAAEARASSVRVAGPRVAVTGGTGFLGRALVRRLLDDGMAVRVFARNHPAPWDRIVGAEYVTADVGGALPDGLLEGAQSVVHCAAATSGGFAEHQRNSIDATANIMRAAASAGVRRFVHVSSMAVVGSVRGAASEASPLEPDARGRGPYVWGKLESERLAVDLARELGMDLCVVRPGAIIDASAFDPPGRLGKRVGPIFVAVGSRRGRFGTIDRDVAAEVLSWMVRNFDDAPPLLNLIDAEALSRGEMVDRLRANDPDLRVVWLPRLLLRPLSGLAVLAQRVLRPSGKPIVLSRVFADQRFDTTLVRRVLEDAREHADPRTSADRAARMEALAEPNAR